MDKPYASYLYIIINILLTPKMYKFSIFWSIIYLR